MLELNRFEQLVIDALSRVPQSYYSTVYKNVESFKTALSGRQGDITGDEYQRYGERVFCYEFYHQLRLLVDYERKSNPAFLSGTELQGEVEKWQISELLATFGFDRLSKEFVPDLLMHSPGNATAHPCVMEVKCIRNLKKGALLYDLAKLNEFITKFNYSRGIFISINLEIDILKELLSSISEEIDNLKAKHQIKIICKLNQESPIIIINL